MAVEVRDNRLSQMNRLAAKYLRPSQIPTKAGHGCGTGMIENGILQAIDELGWRPEDI
ncbi:MAG: hypothetical protein HYU88_06735, partial [Chloroflexi bacterium]|nr:hypothetical protein [Chloroflexota bacterium]